MNIPNSIQVKCPMPMMGTCELCHKEAPLLPFGPGRKQICAVCGFSPEHAEETSLRLFTFALHLVAQEMEARRQAFNN